jgi:hypothetical protein
MASTDLLDISDDTIKGITPDEVKDNLIQHIINCVKSTQTFVIQPLPNILLLNRTQFDILRPSPDFQPTDELMWKTKDLKTGEVLNLMDIHVKGEFEPKPSNLLLLS